MFLKIQLNRTLTNPLILILIGIIVFSPMCSFISMEIFKLPFAAPEILFIPFYLFLKKEKHVTLFTREFISLIFIAIFLFLMGNLNPAFDIHGLLSSLRTYLLIFLFYILFKNNDLLSNNDLFFLCLGSILGSLFFGILRIYIMMKVGIDKEYAVDANIIAIPLLMSLLVFKRNLSLTIAVSAISILASFLSASRGIILFFALSLLLSQFLLLIKSYKSLLRSTIFLILLVILGGILIPKMEPVVEELSPSLHFRLYTKTENSLNNDTNQGDNTRIKNIKFTLSKIDHRILPHGMVSKRNVEKQKREFWLLRDLPFAELLYMLGFPILFVLSIIFLYAMYKLLISYLKTQQEDYAVLLVTSTIFILALFLGYGILMHPFSVPFVGLFLGKSRRLLKYGVNEPLATGFAK